MKRIPIAICIVAFAMTILTGCPIGPAGPTPNPGTPVVQGPACEDIVTYIATIDAIAASWPPGIYTDEVKAAKAWYALARVGAIAGLSKKCPDMVKSLPTAPPGSM